MALGVKRRGNKIKPHVRYETKPGEQLQVDWKEDIEMTSSLGEVFKFNIFTATLGYSRLHTFTYSKTRTTEDFLRCMIDTFNKIGGVPKQVKTDNMAAVVSVTNGYKKKHPIIKQFEKDSGVKINLCKAHTPQTKGKVESLARLVNRIKVYNSEFENLEELENIIIKFNEEINNEICQGTGVRPIDRLREEQKYLNPLPKLDIFEEYLNLNTNKRKVTSESMISINGKKYSVPPQYINMEVFYQFKNEIIEIYNSNQTLICSHSVSNRKLNYRKEDFEQIAEKALTDSNVISKVCASNLAMYDSI
jgi:hypothetical protein